MTDTRRDVEGLDVFCDDLAGRIAAGVSVDRVDAEGLVKVAAEIRRLHDRLEIARRYAREGRRARLDRRRIEAELERANAALREWQQWAAERDFDEPPPKHLTLATGGDEADEPDLMACMVCGERFDWQDDEQSRAHEHPTGGDEHLLEAGDDGGAHYLHSKGCQGACDYDCNPTGFEQAERWWPERRRRPALEEAGDE